MPSIGAKEIPEEKLEEGRREGRIQRLLRLLELRFHTIPESQRAKVQAASVPELDRWLERLLDAGSLDRSSPNAEASRPTGQAASLAASRAASRIATIRASSSRPLGTGTRATAVCRPWRARNE